MTRTLSVGAIAAASLLLSGHSWAETGISLGAGAKADSKGASSNADASSEAETSSKTESTAAEAKKPDQEVLGPDRPYMKRYLPEANSWELGLFGGVLFPSKMHQLYEPGRPESQEGLNTAGEIGFRVGYYPLKFLGAEVEGAGIPTKAKDGTSAGMWAARAHVVAQLPGASITPFLLAGGGALGAASDSMGSDADASFNLGLGAKIALDEHLGIRFDLRDNLTQKFEAADRVQTHHPEILFGITFTPERRRPDYDRDGMNDFNDPCPRLAGEYGGCASPDTDGDGTPDDKDACPDVASAHTSGCADGDADGVEDTKDACPGEAGKGPGGCPEKECPTKDTDGDGRTDSADSCPTEAANTVDGCPVKDADTDGILDTVDKCTSAPETKNGYEDTDGCPDEVPEAVKKFDGVMEGIVFEFGSADIKPSSRPKLEETATIMKEYPSVQIEIAGHTDATGDEKRNKDLSLARADSVKAFLTGQGIAAERIRTAGFGSEKPIADNATTAGKQKNRRIEFHLVRQ